MASLPSRSSIASALSPLLLASALGSAAATAHADVTVTLSAKTWPGFNFSRVLGLTGGQPLVGVLTGATVNVTLNATVAQTRADDLCVYVDVEPISFGGKLQCGGFSNLSAVQRYYWPNGGSSAPGTTCIGTVNFTTPLVFTGNASVDGTVFLGNGYGASGTWTGTVTLHGVVSASASDADADGVPDATDNCPLVANASRNCARRSAAATRARPSRSASRGAASRRGEA